MTSGMRTEFTLSLVDQAVVCELQWKRNLVNDITNGRRYFIYSSGVGQKVLFLRSLEVFTKLNGLPNSPDLSKLRA